MPEDTVIHIVLHHWHIVLVAWIVCCAIYCMPTPNGAGFTGSRLYKYVFAFLHTLSGNIPRLLVTLFPKMVSHIGQKFFGVQIGDDNAEPNPKP